MNPDETAAVCALAPYDSVDQMAALMSLSGIPFDVARVMVTGALGSCH